MESLYASCLTDVEIAPRQMNRGAKRSKVYRKCDIECLDPETLFETRPVIPSGFVDTRNARTSIDLDFHGQIIKRDHFCDLNSDKPLFDAIFANYLGENPARAFEYVKTCGMLKIGDDFSDCALPDFINRIIDLNLKDGLPNTTRSTTRVSMGVDVVNMYLSGKHTTRELAKFAGTTQKNVIGYIKYLLVSKEFIEIDAYLSMVSGRSVRSFPDRIRGFFAMSHIYDKEKSLGSKWGDLCKNFKTIFPELKNVSNNTVVRKLKTNFNIKHKKVKRIPAKKSYVEQNTIEICQSILMAKFISNNARIIYFDETRFHGNAIQSLLGNSLFVPHVKVKHIPNLFMLYCCSVNSMVTAQFSTSAAETSDYISFLEQSINEFRIQEKYGDTIFLYLDNNPCHHASSFRNMCRRMGCFIIYGVKGGPFINLAEDHFMSIKKEKHKVMDPDEDYTINTFTGLCMISHVVTGHDKSLMFLKRFFKKALLKICEYTKLLKKIHIDPTLFRTFKKSNMGYSHSCN